MVRQMMTGWAWMLGLVCVASAGVVYVDDSALGANDGTSWKDAFLYLQDALATASAGQEIRVAQGTYRPDQSSYLDGLIPGDRKASFRLKGGVAILGGYAGFGAGNPDARDVRGFETILSGDLNGNDQGRWFDSSRLENSFNVVTAEGLLSGAALDGFTVTGGYGGPDVYHMGGGLFSHATIGLEVRHCLFHGNFGYKGGGLYDSWSSSSRTTNCVFTNNYGNQGGGVYLNGEFCMTLDHCLIVGNQAEWGGGIYLDEAYTAIVNCTIAQNHARDQWGGVIDTPGTSHFWSCIFWGNTCSDGSVEWANIGRKGDFSRFDYCCVQGWTGQFAGVGTIDAHPFFAKEGLWTNGNEGGFGTGRIFHWKSSDYRLMSQGGRWDPDYNIWVKDWITSPCIDTGDPYGPIGSEPFPNGGVVNMGAYGGTAEASKSWFGKPVCEVIMAGDINGDCTVDLADFAILCRNWFWNGFD